MALAYHLIEIFTSEEARHKGRPLYQAVMEHVHSLKIAARCMVTKGVAGCYENGEMATHGIEILSFNMPIKIGILLPSAQLAEVLSAVEYMVTDGIVTVESRNVHVHRARPCLLPRQIRVREVMTPQPHSVTPDTPASEILRRLLSRSYNGVPVVDVRQHPVGIITQQDLIERAHMPVRLGLLEDMDSAQVQALIEPMAAFSAEAIMRQPVVTVKEEDSLARAVDVMLDKGLKRLPVVNASGALTGMLSRLDVFRSILREAPDWTALQKKDVQVREARVVGDILERDTFTVLPEASVESILHLIATRGLQRIAVVDLDRHLLGMVSDRDLLSVFSAHRAGLWDLLIRKFSFGEMADKHRELAENVHGKTARDVMQTDLVTVTEEMLIDEAIRLMAEKGLKRLPVLDPQGLFKGLISRDALLRTGLAKT